MRIHRKDLEARAATAPRGYLDVVMANRDPARDTETTIYLPNDRHAAVRAWASNPHIPPPKPSPVTREVSRVAPSPEQGAGAGAELKKLLAFAGVNPDEAGCSCKAHAREMDANGTWWCTQNKAKIVGWLQEEMKRRKVSKWQFARIAVKAVLKDPSFPKSLEGLVDRAIANAEKAGAVRYHMHLSARGLGDSICGYHAACGLAESTGGRVAYHAHAHEWLARAKHPLVDVLPQSNTGADGNLSYSGQIAGASTRKQDYCDNLAKAFGVPRFPPVPWKSLDRNGEMFDKNDRIIIAPFSCYESRNWDKWWELARRLQLCGYDVTAIGSAGQSAQLVKIVKGTGAKHLAGASADEITTMMLNAVMVIANDSGIAHLGGFLNVPTLAIHAGCLPHDFLFELAPSVQSVTPGGGLPRSDHNPAVLRRVSVEAVIDAMGLPKATDRLKKLEIAKSRTLLGNKFDTLMAMVRECRVEGDFAELGVYKGGATAGLATCASDRTVHAFDTFAGMPDMAIPLDVHRAGDFADAEDTMEYLRSFSNVRIHQGIFPASAAGAEGRFALVHLDGDLYVSTIEGLKWFWPRLTPGGKIVLDDWEWPQCPGVKKAVNEFFQSIPHTKRLTCQYQMTIDKPPN